MRILYVAMKYDYGKPEQGYSFEHYNFFDSLYNMGHDILYFDFMSLMQQHGRDWVNQKLLQTVKDEKPDLMFTTLYTDELDKAIVKTISEKTDTVTINWFTDDHWRFDNFSRYWAPCFDWVVTTASSAVPKYIKTGYKHAIKSQWACNHFLYTRTGTEAEYDVTFVGQVHGDRREIINSLQSAGIDVSCWGTGWKNGRLSQEEMIQIFNKSKINLNLSNSSEPSGKLFISALNRLPLPENVKTRFIPNAYSEQIKGRNFEVPGCGGFMLTGQADDLGRYYIPDKEIVCYKNYADMAGKIKYYLKHDDERKQIADEGYRRTLREHTYVHRFEEIFKVAGLTYEHYNGCNKPGSVKEII